MKAPHGFQLLKQTPRKDNSKADASANYALDVGELHKSYASNWRSFFNQLECASNVEFGLCAQFDGAARGNPFGPASWGVALWWGQWSLQGFCLVGLLEEHAKGIGTGTNNKAANLGCAFAMELVIRRLLSISEHIFRDFS